MNEATQKAPLEDIMMAMDVVDTLRHQQSIAERELDAQGRRERLLKRLRDMYQAQGIEVPERVLLEGIDALEQERFRYTPVPRSWQTRLAHIWVSRGRWGKPLGFLAVLAAVLWGVYFATDVYPNWKLRSELPTKIDRAMGLIQQRAKNPSVVVGAQQLSDSAKQAVASGDLSRAQSDLSALNDLNQRLSQAYTLRVISRPRENSGVWRIPPGNAKARNYYLIVEAVDANNRVLEVPILSEETNKVTRKTSWGLRVDESTFDRIASDKRDDGIIQSNRVGVKQPGYLKPEYSVPTTVATITEW